MTTMTNPPASILGIPILETKKTRFLALCESMDLKTARQAKNALCDELEISEGTAGVYFHEHRKIKGLAKKRPRKAKTSEHKDEPDDS